MKISSILFFMASLALLGPTCFAKEDKKQLVLANIATKSYPIDSEAGAIVLFESLKIEITPTLSEKKTVHRIIKVLRSDANVASYQFFVSADSAHLANNYELYAATYNAGSDGMVQTELKKEDIYTKQMSNGLAKVSFSFPSVKAGSIIEYCCEMNTPFTEQMMTWNVQEDYPKLFSKFQIIYPTGIEYTSVIQIRPKLTEYLTELKAEKASEEFIHIKNERQNPGLIGSTWIRKNIGVIDNEPFVVHKGSLRERLELHMTGLIARSSQIHFNNSWAEVNKRIWQYRFEEQVEGRNKFMNHVVDSLVESRNSDLDKAKAIFNYVRTNYKCNGLTTIWAERPERVWNRKEGDVGDINLLLTTMLCHADLQAAPLITSTTDGLPLVPEFPILERMTYLVTALTIDSTVYYLDASEKNNCFGLLPSYCFNGYAWVLGKEGHGINLTPSMVSDKIIYAAKIFDFTDTTAKMDLTVKFGIVSSRGFRKQWDADEDRKKEWLNTFAHSFSSGVSVVENSISNIDDPDTSLIVRFKCKIEQRKNAGALFLEAAVMKFYPANPFKVMARKLPLEFGYRSQCSSYVNVMLPDNFVPDSLDKPLIMTYNSDDIAYKRSIGYMPQMHMLTINTSLNINQTTYRPAEYNSISSFFEEMINRNNEIISVNQSIKKLRFALSCYCSA